MTDRDALPSSLPLGLIVAGATTGALLAIGHRLGSVGLPFSAIAAALLRRSATVVDPGLFMIGIGLHVVVTLCWTALFVSLARTRGWTPSVAAVVVVVAAHLLNWLIAWTTGNGLASALPLGDRIVYGVVFAAALVVGIRFAFLTERGTAMLR